MAKKNNTASSAQAEDLEFNNVVKKEYNGKEVEIKKTIGLIESNEAVFLITKACFSGDNGDYTPEYRDFAIKMAIAELYSNIPMPEDIYKRYDYLYNTDAIDFILGEINKDQLKSIIDAADERINYVLKANVKSITEQIENTRKIYDIVNGVAEPVIKALSTGDWSEFSGIIEQIKSAEVAGK